MDDFLDQFMEDHINGGYGDILDELNSEEYDDFPEDVHEYDFEEPWDDILAQQELEDFEQADEYFGYFGDDGFII
ncbi:hypothetical protein C5Y96_18935 [Blastopirellula marina]|uniref:Uncharacterized protein n=1 Tax=Blastopirellula marina TaxID=124 RepID=A0A2S8F640_9BACT|nr:MULTISPECIES: hypothetical protein [Pirellulaceae]PQO27603.1 hypothetical protein C5Y96_18935 [Blastopirellula marina]RCS48140.1 hypothetical protein DTL36_18960 [Bremerella cremea]